MPDEQLGRLAHQFRLFVAADCDRYTPLYARLGSAVAGDAELLSLLAAARAGQQRPTLLFAAVHFLLLCEPDEPLARFYPSITGRPVPAGDPYPPFREFCLANRHRLLALLSTRSTQTNETNRAVALRASLAPAAADLPDVPLALLEVGASAGLNLLFDSFCLPGLFGDPASPVRLRTEIKGSHTPPFARRLPPVVWRSGLDAHPVAVEDQDAVRWLEACLWPEQLERVERFRAAVAWARQNPPQVVAGDMVDDLSRVAAAAPAGTHLIVWHSWAMTYLARRRRPLFAAAVEALCGAGRPVTWLSAEGPGVVEGVPVPPVPAGAPDEERFATLLGMRRFREGTPAAGGHVLLGRCHPHLRWLEWLDETAAGAGRH